MLELLMDVLFPQQTCMLCQRPGLYWSRKPWCDDCQNRLIEVSRSLNICEKCGKYLLGGGPKCRECQENDPAFFVARAVGPYEGCFKKAIGLLKFVGRRTVARRMGEMMAEVVSGEPAFWPIDLIVPVPISAGNLAQRGFNQSELLGEHIARCIKRPLRSDILVRIKETPSQRELSRAEREENLRAAFAVTGSHHLDGKNILLVDDVYTTGSTTRECTKVLLAAGAARVGVITWAAGKGY